MIEVSALPSIANPLGAPAPQSETGEETPISAQFAQLLSLRLGVAPAGAEAPESAASPARTKPHPANGKPGGKTLPGLPPLVSGAVEAQPSEASHDAGAVPQESATARIQILLPEAPAVGIAIVAPPAPVDAMPDAPVSGENQTHAPRTAKALPEMPVALRLPARETVARAPEPIAPADRPASRAEPGQATTAPPASAPRSAGQPVRFLPPAPAAPIEISGRTFAPPRLVPRKADSAEAGAPRVSAEPLPVIEPATAAEPPGIAPAVSPVAQLAASLRQVQARFDTNAPEPGGAKPKAAGDAAKASETPLANQVQIGMDTIAPIAVEIGGPQALPGAPQATLSAPSTMPQSPHDFAELIDRLVEARDALRATLAQRSVEAAIAHAEFGQVQLRFEQDGGALSVSLASPDPEFARAVQAAAPTAQQGATHDNAATPQRNDSQAQQSPGAAPGQSHSQHRGQAAPQHGAEPGDRPAPRSQPDAEAKPQHRNGIFA